MFGMGHWELLIIFVIILLRNKMTKTADPEYFVQN